MACAKQSDAYRALAEEVRQMTAGIPLWNAAVKQRLSAEKYQTCFFTGHREMIGREGMDEEKFRQAVREWLDEQVDSMFYRGYTTFLCGGARGFDLLAAAAVLHSKQLYHPELRLILLLPCRAQTRGWNERDLSLYRAILQRSEAYYLQEAYDNSCMYRRNQLMVDLSITGIAYYDTARGRTGTGMTVRYAKTRGISMMYMPLDGKIGRSDAKRTQEGV